MLTTVQGEKLRSRHTFVLAAYNLLSEQSELSLCTAQCTGYKKTRGTLKINQSFTYLSKTQLKAIWHDRARFDTTASALVFEDFSHLCINGDLLLRQ